jgi:hypothetical protein
LHARWAPAKGIARIGEKRAAEPYRACLRRSISHRANTHMGARSTNAAAMRHRPGRRGQAGSHGLHSTIGGAESPGLPIRENIRLVPDPFRASAVRCRPPIVPLGCGLTSTPPMVTRAVLTTPSRRTCLHRKNPWRPGQHVAAHPPGIVSTGHASVSCVLQSGRIQARVQGSDSVL